MSQRKFASNVVEKCLTFCTPEERQSLVDKMLGTTDENEPLQVRFVSHFTYLGKEACSNLDPRPVFDLVTCDVPSDFFLLLEGFFDLQ